MTEILKSICCFVTNLAISLNSRACKNDHFVCTVGTSGLEARNIRLVTNLEKLTLSKSNSNMMNIYEKGILR
jgi:hypothetical protein